MTEAFLFNGIVFQTARQAKEYMSRLSKTELSAIQQKMITKMTLNSNYGYMPGSMAQKMGRYFYAHREADERNASIWRRLFGDPKPRRKKYTPLPGGASLQYPHSLTVRMNAKKAERITRTGQKTIRKLMRSFTDTDSVCDRV